MILVTSGNGHVGGIIVKALASHGLQVRAFGHYPDAGSPRLETGVEYVEGDFFDPPTLRRAFEGVDQVFHIAPPDSSGEYAIGQAMIELAAEFKIRQFVFFSVIHPYIALPQHRMKLLVEQYLVDSAVPYTILQPTIFLQTAGIEKALQDGSWTTPYSVDIPMSYVDLEDVAVAARVVLTEPQHLRATYELVSTEPISVRQMVACINKETNRQIAVQAISPENIGNDLLRSSVAEAYFANYREMMWVYYNRHGLTGSSNVLEFLLKHKPNNLQDYLKRVI